METFSNFSKPNPNITTTAVGLRYGLLTGLAGTIVSFGLNAAHLEQSSAKWLTVLVLIGGIVLAQLFYKKANDGFMSYGEGLGIGMVLSAVSGVISAVFSYIYTHFIDPDMMARILEKVRSDMEAKGGISDEQIDQAMGITTKMMTEPIMSVVIILGSLLTGLIASLVVSAIIKNSKPEFE